MSSSGYLAITILINCLMIKICDKIDLKSRANTNTVVYFIGYAIGCIVMAILMSCYHDASTKEVAGGLICLKDVLTKILREIGRFLFCN